MKLNFKLWLEAITLGTEEVDERQIDSAYQNAKFAVKLVQMYDKTLPANDKLLLKQRDQYLFEISDVHFLRESVGFQANYSDCEISFLLMILLIEKTFFFAWRL